MVTLGPLSAEDEPSSYDLCLEHARHLQVPAGWRLERIALPQAPQEPSESWLMSLADEVRNIGWRDEPPEPDPAGVIELGRRGHLRVITDAASPN